MLTNIDDEARTADCSCCGRVKTAKNGNRRMCYNKVRAYKLKSMYNIDINAADIPIGCEICGSQKKISLDHCHTTNKNRGWLCASCNVTLGFAKDNPETLRKLANYLDKHKHKL